MFDRLSAIMMIVLLGAASVRADSDVELAELRDQIQQMRQQLVQTQATLAQTQKQIAALTANAAAREGLNQWRAEQAKHDVAERALFRERIRMNTARANLARTVEAESRKVEALQPFAIGATPPQPAYVAPQTVNAPYGVGYGYTQQYGWPYNNWSTYPGYHGYSGVRTWFSSGYYQPRIYRSGFRLGYHDKHVNIRIGGGDFHHNAASGSNANDVQPRASVSPQSQSLFRAGSPPHPAFRLNLRR